MTADIIRLPVAESTSETLFADFLAGLTPSTAKVYRRYGLRESDPVSGSHRASSAVR